jgi:chlorite dismutase
VRTWEASDDLILRTYSLVGLRAGVDFMLWQIAFDPLAFQSMEATIRRSRFGRLPDAGAQFPVAAAPVAVRQQSEGRREGLELLPGQGKFLFVYPFTKTRAVVSACRPTRGRG